MDEHLLTAVMRGPLHLLDDAMCKPFRILISLLVSLSGSQEKKGRGDGKTNITSGH